ncbi:MAG: NADPH:quinone oxidoreductase family protein [Acidimicrobiales bacterium]
MPSPPDTIRAWQVHELGDPLAVLRLDHVTPPRPAVDQVLIEVGASAVNFADTLLCRGTYQEKPPLPFTPGLETCGRVLVAPPGAPVEPGQRVIALPALPHGGFAEQAVAAVTDVFAVPDGMDDVTAAALPVTYQTGWFGLYHRAGLHEGETVLVHAGAGGVGSAAIQLAKARGARVIATAGGPDKVTLCRTLGADIAVDYRADDFVAVTNDATGGRGADVIYDSVGGDTFDRSRKCIAFEGRIVVVGFAGGRIAEAPTNHLLVKTYGVLGLNWGTYRRLDPALVHRCHDELVALHAQGLIAPLIGSVRSLDEVPRALDDLAGRATTGKVVVVP